MATYLRCRISPGLFSSEYAVHGESHNKESFSMFVPQEDVDFEERVQEAGVAGWVRVEVLAEDGDLFLVRLPGQTFENGTTITVSKFEVSKRNPRELA